MGTFRYAALEASGNEVAGQLVAPDPAAAAAELRARALLPIEIAETAPAARGGAPSVLSITRTQDVILLLRQVALMLRAGLTILDALDVARLHCRKRGLAGAIGRVREAVVAGRSLSAALAHERRIFPEVADRLIQSAEASGDLDVTLDRVAEHLERQLELRQSLIATLSYPAVVVLAAGGVAGFLVVKVIPAFARFLERRAIPLPRTTRLLIDVATFIQTNGLAIAGALLAVLAAFLLVRSTRRGARATDRALLAIPIVGPIVTAAAMAQLGRTLATLLRGGVTILEALRLLAGTVLNRAVAAQVERAAAGVLEGKDLASGLSRGAVPDLVTQVVGVGERSGSLEHVLDELGRFYEGELRRLLKRFAALLEPTVIVVVGGIVGFVYFAFFQALMQMATRGH